MDFSNNNLNHIIISKQYRDTKRMIYKIKNNISDEHLLKNLSETIQLNNKEFITYIVEIKRENKENIIEDNIQFFIIDVTFTTIYIPKLLVQELINNNFKRCKFYIGNFTEKEKFLIKSEVPKEEEISKKDEKDNLNAFNTEELNFEIFE